MQCDTCGEQEATVHLTQMVNGTVKKIHLCEQCAEQSGIDVNGPVSLSDVLFGMGAPSAAPAGQDKSCKACGLTRGDFKKTSRLGCPACYDAFAEELEPLLAAMHKGTRHAGKVPAAEAAGQESGAEVEAMRQQLKEAIAAENYEEAARLRDLIRQERKKARAEKAKRRRIP